MTRFVPLLGLLILFLMPGCAPGADSAKGEASPMDLPPVQEFPESQPAARKAAQEVIARPAEDVARDANRKPEQVLDFVGIKEGDRVVDLLSGTGYYTDILARRVGRGGRVLAVNNGLMDKFTGKALKVRLAKTKFSQVSTAVMELQEGFTLPQGQDAVLMVRMYHDLIYFEGVDRVAMNRAIFQALKPGGTYTVVDYSAKEGAGSSVSKTLHRLESTVVQQEVEAAGFKLSAQSDVLRHPEDDLSTTAFGRGDTADRYILKFIKP